MGWSWNPSPESGISMQMIAAGGLEFETAVAGEGDLLALMLHGFPELNYSWRHQIPMLVARGYRVWAPNLRGYGATSRPQGVREYAVDRLVGDIVALIRASEAKEVLLIAHDWGALIAWAVAILHPDLIDRLVIMNVPHPMAFRREMQHWRQKRKSWYIFFFQLPRLPEWMLGARGARAIGRAFTGSACHPERFAASDVQVYRDAALRPGQLGAMVNYYRALFRHRDAVDLGDARVSVPTLMVWGEQDIAIDIHCTDDTDQWVDDLTLVRLPNASHWVQQDQPEEVNAALADWLDRRAV
ncbi:MAG: alpha/beta fold hydrolase [Blastomonas sp.]